jgi:hypothetical protein
MSDLENMIEAVKQGDLERVRAFLESDDRLANQRDASYLAIELNDVAYAIQLGDTRWVARFLKRFPSLRQACDTNGTPFQRLARESGNREIAGLFGLEDVS